ncbi:PREDICTED: prolactin-releasing peptide receptor-like [Papilio xuthus]|uniref:Neuropeptide Y receptor type 2 n=1 Tax=Papilio xuthus TaxID=66420 RepID=A0A194Q9E0_PAPXU|nr:PREDICTED: prolactin-releasing peptide receptor-like [Papilio xuthus]KPJ02118.1 Neuropeptide Y receptor type 2 [Papilio xuthus]
MNDRILSFTAANNTQLNNVTSRNITSNLETNGYENIIDNKFIQGVFCVIYTIIFVLGLLGNLLVCFVVLRNKAMQTVTNLFITNLALSDILLCIFAVPFTPLYSFRGSWNWGSLLCHVMPFAQGCSVYISTLTLMSIAIDRFFVIIYPFRPRMKVETCITVIIMIWTFAITVTMPYAIYMTYYDLDIGRFCEETWPTEKLRRVFGSVTSILQFVLPFIVIAFCYTCVSFKLNDRAKAKAVSKNTRKEEFDKNRKRRTNQMLIAMVTIFGLSWLPLNVINLCNDYYIYAIHLKYYFLIFFIGHVIAMSSTCYNPFIYAWMNENFRKEFKQLIPCIDTSAQFRGNIQMEQLGVGPSEKTFNGTNTTTDSYLSSSTRPASFRHKRKPSAAADVEKSGVELNEDLLTVDVKHCHISTSYNLRRESVKLRLINEESFDGSPSQSQF